MLAPKPKIPKTSPENLDRLNASIEPRTPRKIAFGTTALATDIRDQEYTDDQTYFHRFVVVAAHKVNQIQQIWFDNKLAWTVGAGVQGEFVGYLDVTAITEGASGNAINISARMGATRRYTGCAYIHLKYKLTGNTKKQDSPFAQGITTRITVVGDGMLFYDPRKDSTVGGSGAHRADNQATWEWDTSACRNPALQVLNYLLGWRINGVISVGRGIPASRIDMASFIAAANLCDEGVPIAAGGNEPRYRSHGVFSEADGPTTVLDNLKACMNADLDDVGGKIRLTVFHNDLALPVATFTKDDFLDEWEWRAAPALDEQFNVVRGVYTDPSETSLYQQVDYPSWEIASPDGIERAFQLDLPYVQNPRQAERLSKLKGMRQQYGGMLRTTMQATAWRVAKNDVVLVPNPGRNWAVELMRVVEIEHRIDGTVPIVLREEHADIYAWSTAEEGNVIAPVAASTFNPSLDPVRQALIETSAGAALNSSYTRDLAGNITQTNAGASVTVNIPAHVRVYGAPYPEASVSAGMITGLPYSSDYMISYDDPAFAGGAVTYQAWTNAADAYASEINPGRHFVAFVTTIASGGTGGSVGGTTAGGLGKWENTADFYNP